MVDSDVERRIERICIGFNRLGIDARLVKSGRIEQHIGIGGLVKVHSSLGLIEIMDGPIGWINLKEARQGKGPEGGVEITYSMDYGVPLAGEPKLSRAWVFALGRKKFPIFGPVVQLRWKGGGWGQKVADQLNWDGLMLQPSVMGHGMELTWNPEHFCWTISTEAWRVPSMEQWNAYLALARHLVTTRESRVQSEPPAF